MRATVYASVVLFLWVGLMGFGDSIQAKLSDDSDAEWVALTDGKSFDGWKINENESSWKFEDGAFVAQGDRSHLFYVGDDKPFTNFEFKAKVK